MEVIVKGIADTTIFHEKRIKATISGLTVLKEGKYKGRYKLAHGYAMMAQGEIIVKPKDLTAVKPKTPKALKLNTDSMGEIEPHTTNRKKSYSIAKQIVRNRMRAMINMLQQSRDRIKKPKLYFFTVSFLAGTPDNLCYQVLNTWLTELRQRKLLLSYLWVAERQGNGTIHFHLAVPHYMKAPYVNRIMKKILLDQKNKGALPDWDRKKLMKYNGVDIAKNRKTKRPLNFAAEGKGAALANYLTKYITKNNTEMGHLAWHCSRDWSGLILGMTFTRAELGKFVTRAMIDINCIETEYCSFYRWAKFKPPEKFARHLGEMNYGLLHWITQSEDNILYNLN